MNVENDVKEAIKTHIEREWPREVCGVIVPDGKKQRVTEGRNIANDPLEDFILHPEDLFAAEEISDKLVIYHSHSKKLATPTTVDVYGCNEIGYPYLICGWPSDTWELIEPTGFQTPLEGRPFIHGIMDCYSLIRDYYNYVLKIKLPNFYRPDDWWKPETGLNLYEDNLGAAGFVNIKDEPRVHDCFGFIFEGKVIHHAAVYVGEGAILHHPPKRLSLRAPFVSDRGLYANSKVKGNFRHKELM